MALKDAFDTQTPSALFPFPGLGAQKAPSSERLCRAMVAMRACDIDREASVAIHACDFERDAFCFPQMLVIQFDVGNVDRLPDSTALESWHVTDSHGQYCEDLTATFQFLRA